MFKSNNFKNLTRISFLFLFTLLLASCSKNDVDQETYSESHSEVQQSFTGSDNNTPWISINCSGSEYDWFQSVSDEFLYHSIQLSDNLNQLSLEEYIDAYQTIENSTQTYEGIEGYVNFVTSLLPVESEAVQEYLTFYEENQSILIEEEFYTDLFVKFENLVDKDIICVDLNNTSSRECSLSEMFWGVATGAATIISCGACVGGVLVSCLGCATGINGTIATNSCWF